MAVATEKGEEEAMLMMGPSYLAHNGSLVLFGHMCKDICGIISPAIHV